MVTRRVIVKDQTLDIKNWAKREAESYTLDSQKKECLESDRNGVNNNDKAENISSNADTTEQSANQESWVKDGNEVVNHTPPESCKGDMIKRKSDDISQVNASDALVTVVTSSGPETICLQSGGDGEKQTKIDDDLPNAACGQITLSTGKEVGLSCAIADGVATIQGPIEELDCKVLPLVANAVKRAVSILVGGARDEVEQSRLISVSVKTGIARKTWTLSAVDGNIDFGNQNLFAGLASFVKLLSDEVDVWTNAAEQIAMSGTTDGEMLKISRELRDSAGKKKLAASAVLECKGWPRAISLPGVLGKGRQPKVETTEENIVGHVTGSDWQQRTVNVCEEGKNKPIEMGYDQAQIEDAIEEARKHRENLYTVTYGANRENGEIKSRSLRRIRIFSEDIFCSKAMD